MKVWLAVAAMATGVAAAQTSGGSFRGSARDPSGAFVPGVRIVIRAIESGIETTTESNREGLWVSPTLIPASYVLTARKKDFQTEEFGPVTLRVNQAVRVDFELRIGETLETVVVEASGTQLLALESAEISEVIPQHPVSQMPLDGRSWQHLIALAPGVNPGSPGESGSPNPVNVNGQRTKANLFLVDGLSTTSSAQGRGNNFNMPLEAVQEFSVQSGAYSAEYGNVAGGVVNLQSKSGTNHWHGSLFEFLRNDRLDAANYFSNATGEAKSPLRFNQFGGAIGGPLRRNRTFVFGDYQGTLTRRGRVMVASVPVEERRRGDFSGLRNAQGALIPVYDPFAAAIVREPFPNNIMPAARIDPAAESIAAALPMPNQFDGSGRPATFNNFATTRSDRSGVHSFDVRADHQFSPVNSLFARYSAQQSSAVTPSLFGDRLGGPPTGAGESRARFHNAGIGHTYQLGANLINDIRIGANRQTTQLQQEGFGENLSEQFGIPGVNRSAETSGLSSINVAGQFVLGGSILTPLRLAATNWNFSEKLIWVRGRHVLRTGFDYQHDIGSTGYLVFGRGYYTFLNLTTSTAVGTPGGDAFASFLTGAPFQVLRDDFPAGMVGLRSSRYGWYVQDDIKASSRLTLNLGARYDVMPYPREMYDRLSNFDPETGTMLLAGQGAPRRLRATDWKNLAPRVGLAYAWDELTAIRAGYGIGYADPLGGSSALNSNQFNIPFYVRDNITQFPFTAPAYVLSNRLPALAPPDPSAPTGDQRYLTPNDGNQYSQTWSLSLQRALGNDFMIEAAYVGTSGSRLLMTSNINAAPPGAKDPATRRPYGPALGEIRQLSNGAHSSYHGLQLKAEKRYGGGLYFLAAYTWSKSLDNQSTGTDDSAAAGQFPQDPADHDRDRGPSSFDRTHRFTASAVWEIPLGAWSRRNSSAVRTARAALGGWQLSGILQAQTGSPFSIVTPCATINAEGNNCRPDRIADGALPSGMRSLDRWFDPSAFVIPATPRYGNAGRNVLRGPGSAVLDLSLSKSILLGGEAVRRLQIRAEFFNALNRANFGLPVHSMDSPALGSITAAASARVIQLGARFEF